MNSGVQLNLRLGDDAGDDELAELIELLQSSGATSAEVPVLGAPTPGYRNGENPVADIVATVEPAVGLLGRIFGGLRGWLAARPQRAIEMTVGDATIKITGLSTTNEDRMVDAFIRRVSEGK